MRGATRASRSLSRHKRISIHAPHARSDGQELYMGWQASRISIHAPHARSDAKTSVKKYIAMRFQSTLLMRGATAVYDWCQRAGLISIHAPHARSDSAAQPPRRRLRFQSTLLMRGATRRLCSSKAGEKQISIHAPHARSDFHLVPLVPARDDFNPRSSCEERPHSCRLPSSLSDFNPRSSCEERLPSASASVFRQVFQSTLLMRGATGECQIQSTIYTRYFNPRSSCEERRGSSVITGIQKIFQSTLLMRGATAQYSPA